MHPKAFLLWRLLSDGEFHSGEALAAELDVSRATVWNLVQALRAARVKVYSVTGRGYKLAQPVSTLGVRHIQRYLHAAGRALHIELAEQVDSSNSELMRRASRGQLAHGACLIAELQTHGRGRRGRSWLAGLGGGITFSLAWHFEQGAAHLSALSLAVGVALAQALERFGVAGIELKWPNDLIHRFHKLAGILIELEGDVLGPSVAVIGVGINVRLSDALRGDIDQAVTDLESLAIDAAGGEPKQDAEVGATGGVDRNRVLACVLDELAGALARYAAEGFAPFRPAWLKRHAYHAREVWLQLPNGERLAGRVEGVGDDGSLLLDTEQGQKRYTVGEISVRAAQKVAQ